MTFPRPSRRPIFDSASHARYDAASASPPPPLVNSNVMSSISTFGSHRESRNRFTCRSASAARTMPVSSVGSMNSVLSTQLI